MKVIHITKQVAAIRQVKTALELFFQGKDEISTHTLASAAYNIFRDLAANGVGKTVLMKQDSLRHIEEQHHKKWLGHMNKFENFFKHADRDHDQELDFYPGSTEFVLWEDCLKVVEIEGNSSPLIGAFFLWFTARHYEAILTNENIMKMDPDFKEACDKYKTMDKEEFYAKILPTMRAYENTDPSKK